GLENALQRPRKRCRYQTTRRRQLAPRTAHVRMRTMIAHRASHRLLLRITTSAVVISFDANPALEGSELNARTTALHSMGVHPQTDPAHRFDRIANREPLWRVLAKHGAPLLRALAAHHAPRRDENERPAHRAREIGRFAPNGDREQHGNE